MSVKRVIRFYLVVLLVLVATVTYARNDRGDWDHYGKHRFHQTVELNGPITLSDTVTLGDGGDTVTINSSDWDISATGNMTGIGNIVFDGYASNAVGTLTISNITVNGAVTVAGDITANGNIIGDDSTIGTNLASLYVDLIAGDDDADALVIGDGGETIAVNSSDWDIDTSGNMTGIGNFVFDGYASNAVGTLTISNMTVNGDQTIAGHLDIDANYAELSEIADPATPGTNTCRIFLDDTDGDLKAIDDNGEVITIANFTND